MKKTFSRLRRKAEKIVQREQIDISNLSEDDIQGMVHNLEVHRVELEMQNDELQMANRKMREAQTKYTELFEFAPVGYVTLDRDFKIETFNQTFTQMLGCERNQIVNRVFTDLIHPDSQDAFHLARRRFVHSDQRQTLDLQFNTADQTELWTTAEMIHRTGSQSYWISLSDISARKAFEYQLIKARKAAENANHAKSDFLANMSHELRTPLNAIIGFAQLLAREPDMTPTQRKHLEIINRSGEHLLSLINDVLDMSKIEAGRVRQDVSNFDLWELLRSVEEMIQVRANNKHIQFRVERSSDTPQYIQADNNKLRQILINLLDNAVKYTDEGCVTLRIDTEKGNSQTFPSRLHFEIEDSGMGIPPEEMEDIFDPFARSSDDNRQKKGTGLGLSISRQFVRLMGGDINVRSVFGKGSVFRFDIQVRPPDMSQLENLSQPRRIIRLAPGQPTWRLLVVDDNEPSRLLLSNLLESVGFDVREAVDGHDAMEQCQTYRPHLIWMDMRMPVMDGYEATRRLKADSSMDAKIIALTAHVFEEHRNRILAAGCDDFIRKPYREHEIFETIGKHLEVAFIYEEAEDQSAAKETPADCFSDLCAADLTAIPSERLTTLKQVIITGNPNRIKAILAQIRIDKPDLADALQKQVDDFEFDKVLALIEKALEQ